MNYRPILGLTNAHLDSFWRIISFVIEAQCVFVQLEQR